MNEIRTDQIEALRTDRRICEVAHAGQDFQCRTGDLDARPPERDNLAVAQRAKHAGCFFKILFLHPHRHRIVLFFVAMREPVAADFVPGLPQDAGIAGDLLRLPGDEKNREPRSEFTTGLQHLLKSLAFVLIPMMRRVVDISRQEDCNRAFLLGSHH